MRDTEYFRQLPQNTIESKAQTNHLRSVECTKENCVSPLSESNVLEVCTKGANFTREACDTILKACNDHCLPITRSCASETVQTTPCLAFYEEFNKYT